MPLVSGGRFELAVDKIPTQSWLADPDFERALRVAAKDIFEGTTEIKAMSRRRAQGEQQDVTCAEPQL